MNHVIPAAFMLALLAGCAQLPDSSVPVADRAQAPVTENPYGVILIQEPVDTSASPEQDSYAVYGADSVSTFIPPDRLPALDTEPLQPQAEPDPSNLDADGLYALGRQYIEGDGVEQNAAIGEHYISLSAELGKDEAKRVLGLIRLRRDVSDAEALAMLEEAAETSLKAQMQLGFLYANQAQPHLNDKPKGLALIEKAYRGGSGEAAYYYSRIVARTDPQASKEAMSFAVTQGFSKALLAAAKTSGSTQGSAELYLRAARSGDPAAMYEYANGLLIRKYKPTLTGFDHPAEVEALAWFSLASELGNGLATTEVGNLKGVAVDMARRGTSLDEVKRKVQKVPAEDDGQAEQEQFHGD
ncbi:sel1 repeat family protein (plasmid) [Pseudomonas sp. Leaf58]|nr:sel1 repeat family protein [Pseudomonas sp. Leaf58]